MAKLRPCPDVRCAGILRRTSQSAGDVIACDRCSYMVVEPPGFQTMLPWWQSIRDWFYL